MHIRKGPESLVGHQSRGSFDLPSELQFLNQFVATLKKPENRPHYVKVFGSTVLRVFSQEVNDVTKKRRERSR